MILQDLPQAYLVDWLVTTWQTNALYLSTILFAEFTVLVLGRPCKILTGDLVLFGAPAAFGVGSRFASSRATMRIIGRTTFAVVIGLMFI